MRFSVFVIGALLIATLTVMAQSFPTLATFPASTQPGFVAEIAALDDIDGDGIPDVAVVSGLANTNSAGVYSGATGALITLFPPFDAIFGAGKSILGCGDWDADGLEDVAIQAPEQIAGVNAPSVKVYSSASGLLLATFPTALTFTPMLDVLEDLDGDSIPELLVPSPVVPGIAVISSATGAELLQFPASSIALPVATVVDDHDQDGLDDILVAENIIGSSSPGPGIIYGSVSGAVIRVLNFPQAGAQIIDQIERLGDLDGDQVDETAVVLLGGLADRVMILDGTGAELESLDIQTRNTTSFFQNYVGALGDVNGDGADDFLVVDFAGVTDPNLLEMTVFSGSDLCPLGVFETNVDQSSSARFVDVGDTNGDGLDDLLLSVSAAVPNQPSTARVTIEALGGRGLYGAGSTLAIDWIPGPSGQRLDGRFELHGGTPNGTAVIITSSRAVQVPVGPFDLAVDLTRGEFLAVNVPMDALGELDLPLSLNLPIVSGTPVYLQAFEQAAAGIEGSNGLGLLFSAANEAPVVTSVSPSWLPPGSSLDPGTLIMGDCFAPGVSVALNGTLLDVSSTSDPDVIHVSGQPAPMVPVNSLLTVANPNGETATFVYNPAPIIESLEVPGAPTDELATIGGELVNLRGLHFFPGSVLTIDGTTVTPNVINETFIAFESIPLLAGMAPIVVTSPNGGVATFSAVVVQRSPDILSVEPISAIAGDQVTIRGEFFAAGLSVTLGGQSLSATVINTPGLPPGVQVTVPSGVGCDAALIVTNPDGASDASTFNPSPVVNSYTSTVPAGVPFVVTLFGPIETLENTSITINGVPTTILVATPTGITVGIPPNPPGTVDIVITNIAGCSLTLPLTFL